MLNKKLVQQANLEEEDYIFLEEDENIVLDSCEVCVKITCCALAKNNNFISKQLTERSKLKYKPVGREISGVVGRIGDSVRFCKPGDDVVGIIPLGSIFSGCATYCVMSEFDIVVKPENVTHLNAACGVGDALKAYTALFYQARIVSGETIVIASAACGAGILTTQLAVECGARVIGLGSTDEEIDFLNTLDPPVLQVIDLRDKNTDIVSKCFEETGGLGVDCFLDNGVEMYEESVEQSDENGNYSIQLSKYDVISSLGVGGRWITCQNDLQLDPPDSTLLTMKCASVHFLFEDSWTLSRGAQGKYLHILTDIMNKMGKGILKPTVHHTILLNDVIETLHKSDVLNVGRIVVKI